MGMSDITVIFVTVCTVDLPLLEASSETQFDIGEAIEMNVNDKKAARSGSEKLTKYGM